MTNKIIDIDKNGKNTFMMNGGNFISKGIMKLQFKMLK